ncbi:MAG: tetratricopeptide repeat protein [Candidatus Yanofskybacteria bacterium]|nr:tetratricopeptide repeat protein [Candidatus Yanofskybacteria bacterium]
MDNFGKKKFEIQSIIEQKPFENTAVRAFFKKWCEANDSIVPEAVSRDDWEQKDAKDILEKRPDGKQTLYLPHDLQLWEMVGVMEVVDRDTFAVEPERQIQKKKELLALGKLFQNSGRYIAQRLDSIEHGKEIASALAEEFYNYGQSLVVGKKAEAVVNLEDIASNNLTPSEVEEVDRFLAGDNLYKSRQARAEKARGGKWAKLFNMAQDKRGEFYEAERRKTLAQFFRASEKAFELKQKTKNLDLKTDKTELKPWQNDAPVHQMFLEKVERAISQKIETPKRELVGSIFRRGMELLYKSMPFDTLPEWVKNAYLHWDNGENTLREALQIDRLKTELEDVRQSGSIVKISDMEQKITDKIQGVVSRFTYKSMASSPSEMVASQLINCVGASVLGGALMKEVGLNYLVGHVPEHSILFLITKNGHVEWRDMLSAKFNEELTDEMITGRKKDGSRITVKDIAEFSRNPKPRGLTFALTKSKMTWLKKWQRQDVTVFEAEYGQKVQVLSNMGAALFDLGRYEEATEVYRWAIAVDPEYVYAYNNLGSALFLLGRYEEATEVYQQGIAVDSEFAQSYDGLGSALLRLGRNIEAIETFRKALAIDPEFDNVYNGLGNAFLNLNRYKEAIDEYRKALIINSKFAYPYFGLGFALHSLGHKREAIEAYQKFIDLADKQKDEYWIKEAKRVIFELKDK